MIAVNAFMWFITAFLWGAMCAGAMVVALEVVLAMLARMKRSSAFA